MHSAGQCDATEHRTLGSTGRAGRNEAIRAARRVNDVSRMVIRGSPSPAGLPGPISSLNSRSLKWASAAVHWPLTSLNAFAQIRRAHLCRVVESLEQVPLIWSCENGRVAASREERASRDARQQRCSTQASHLGAPLVLRGSAPGPHEDPRGAKNSQSAPRPSARQERGTTGAVSRSRVEGKWAGLSVSASAAWACPRRGRVRAPVCRQTSERFFRPLRVRAPRSPKLRCETSLPPEPCLARLRARPGRVDRL